MISNTDDKDIQQALRLANRCNKTHTEKQNEWRLIQALFEEQFDVWNPVGTKKISSKLLQQVIWKAVGKMKFLDFDIHGSGAPEANERIVTDGVATVLDEGNLASCLRDKGGVFYKMLLFGDAFIQLGTDEDSPYPIRYRVTSLSDIFIDHNCTDVRDPVSGLSADDILIIYSYTKSQFEVMYPDFTGKVAKGKIPRTYDGKQLEKTWQQEVWEEDEEIEVAHYYCLSKKVYVTFAGSSCTRINKLKGEKYPFLRNKKPYLPVIHFKCFPSTEGFYNYGLGQLLFDIAVVTARMDNMAYNHASDNIDPINFISLPNGGASSFFNKVLQAYEQKKAGGKGFAVFEQGNMDKGTFQVQPLQTQPITNEWERAFMRLEQQVTRLGFQIDAVDRGGSVTATQIISEEENADMTIKQIMEFNASECKALVDFSIAIIQETVDKKDDTPLNITTKIKMDDGQEVPIEGVTLGAIVEELNARKYFVKINSRSGAIPSNVMKQAQIARTMATLPPGSPAFNKMAIKSANLNDQDITLDDLTAPQPVAAGGAPEEGGLSETEMGTREFGGNMPEQPMM
jgi:hypothetical protein